MTRDAQSTDLPEHVEVIGMDDARRVLRCRHPRHPQTSRVYVERGGRTGTWCLKCAAVEMYEGDPSPVV